MPSASPSPEAGEASPLVVARRSTTTTTATSATGRLGPLNPAMAVRPADSGAASRWDRKKALALLGVFCCLAFLQNSVFVEWNPIQSSAKFAFSPEWSSSTFAWQANLATITSPATQLPVWWAIRRFGLSRTIRWAAALPLLISAGLSCLPLAIDLQISNTDYIWCTYAAYVFTGVTGVVFFSSITRFSRVWFPPDHRTTSTGMLCTFANMGSLLPALVGPLLVTEPDSSSDKYANSSSPLLDPDQTKMDVRRDVFHYQLMYLAATSAVFLTFLAYFPSENSARNPATGQDDEDEETTFGDLRVVWNNLLAMLKKPNVVLIMTLQSFSIIPFLWASTLLTETLSPVGFTQHAVGVLIVATTGCSFLATLASSRLADMCFRFRIKALIVIILALHSLCMIGEGLAYLYSGDRPILWYFLLGFHALGISLLNSASPLIYELAAEVSHPVPEYIVNGMCNQCNNVVGAVFFLVYSELYAVFKDDYSWLIYTLMGLPSVVTILFVATREAYLRSEATSVLNTEALVITSSSPPSTPPPGLYSRVQE